MIRKFFFHYTFKFIEFTTSLSYIRRETYPCCWWFCR